MSEPVQVLVVIGLVMGVVIAFVVWVARDAAAARARAAAGEAAPDREAEPDRGAPGPGDSGEGQAGEGRLPLLEVALMRLPAATADALRGRLAASPDPAFVGAVAVPIAAFEPVLGLLAQALERAGCRLPLVAWDGHVRGMVEAQQAAAAVDALDRALGPRRGEVARALVELDPARPSEGVVAAVLTSGAAPPRETASAPALDAARLVAPLRELCREAAGRGESVLALTRHTVHRETLRVAQGMDPIEAPPRVFCLELQVARAPADDEADPRALFLTPTRSAALPSRRQTLLLLVAGLAGAGLEAPFGELGGSGMVFSVAPGDMAALVRALEAARGDRRGPFVEALLEVEREDPAVRPGARSSPAPVEEALASGELRGELPTLAAEAAALVLPLLTEARGAREAGQSLALCYRTCDLVRGG